MQLGGSFNMQLGGSFNMQLGGSFNMQLGGSFNMQLGGSSNMQLGGSSNMQLGGSSKLLIQLQLNHTLFIAFNVTYNNYKVLQFITVLLYILTYRLVAHLM